MMEGNYTVSQILLVGTNSDGRTFTKRLYLSNRNLKLQIVNDRKDDTKDYKLTELSLKGSSAKQGDKVYLDVKASEPITVLKLVFTSKNGKEVSFYVKELKTTNPYFIILSSVEPNKYELDKAVVTFNDVTKIYTRTGRNNTDIFAFNSTIEVETAEQTYNYNNEDINDEILSKLYNAPEGTRITVQADSNTFVVSEVFETIKGKNKDLVVYYKDNQIIFNGRDITNPKTIDVSIKVDSVENNESINKLVDSGIVVNFSDNGNLPGKALVKIKSTDEIEKQLNKTGYVYFYNAQNNNFTEIDTKLEKDDNGYYSFNINHNSDYLLVNKKLPSSMVVADNNVDAANFIKSNRSYIVLISLGILLIVGVIVLIVIMKRKETPKKKSKKEE
jgi:hypothetical protein